MIAILLATYNGEKYIRQQLDSVFNQSYTDFILFVRDDGSRDNTMDIIKEYERRFSNIKILNDTISHRGACMSFMWMLKQVEADYYMFCDQDDVWFNTKVQVCFDVIQLEEKRSKDSAILVHTDLIITDDALNPISPSLWANNRTDPFKITTKYLPLVNYVTGCTMLFNRIARDLSVNYIVDIDMHDFWVAMSVDASKGKIINLPFPTAFYRQHSNNVVGASIKQFRFPRIQRYLHLPDFRYSYQLFKVIRFKYNIGLFKYLYLRISFYLTH